MKRKFLLLTLSGAFAVLVLSSNATGPAHNSNGNKTGGPGSSGTCSSGGCHSSSTNTTMTISLKKKSDGVAVTNGQYSSGTTYVVTVSGNHQSLNNFGFQVMALKSDNTNAGVLLPNSSADVHKATVAGKTVVEQHHVLSKTGGAFTVEFDWMAPSSGTGGVTFYGILNAVNGDGQTTGDAVSQPITLALTENPTSVTDVDINKNINVYPNPVSNDLKISFSDAVSGKYALAVYDLKGQKVIAQDIEVNHSTLNIPANNLAGGVYHLVISNGSEKHTVPFIKQ